MTTKDNVLEKLSSTQELINDCNIYEIEIDDYLNTMDRFLRELFCEKCREQGISTESAMQNFIDKTGDDKIEI